MLLLSIKNRPDFIAIGKNNTCFYSSTILLLARKSPEKYSINPRTGKIIDFCRVGYTVTKVMGNAVVRNKIKRRYRHAFRLLFKNYAHSHFDYVILARREVPKADFNKIYHDLEFCFKGINRLLKKNANNANQSKKTKSKTKTQKKS